MPQEDKVLNGYGVLYALMLSKNNNISPDTVISLLNEAGKEQIMTNEEKQLLLKDLGARLSYGVICHTEEGDGYLCSINQTIFGTEYGLNINPLKRDYFNDSETDEQAIKPYLRPVSSMTEEEENEYRAINSYEGLFPCNEDALDYVLEHHLDFRGLIPMGLALEAPEGMYD